jgi:EF-P beta-lysylation protein EpmB
MDDFASPELLSPRPAWLNALADSIQTPAELLRLLDLDPALPTLDYERLAGFPLRVPRGFARLMRKSDPHDPLFLQVWPSAAEAQQWPGFVADPVGDLQKLKHGGVIHKYRGRALLVATGACAVHCRYCFRREFPYSDALASRGQWRTALDTIAADATIEEVILSGGDPLALTDDKLAALVDALEAIPHVRRLRIHTRLPVVLPERVDEKLLFWLGKMRLQRVIVLHVNHPAELGTALAGALARLRTTGATLLNQSVLLKNVNDSAETLALLSEKLFTAGVLPYYLHLLDRVQGAGHFEVDEWANQVIMRELNSRLPGYLVPRLVREVAGAPAKQPVPW